ncbi:MAG TPA: hypothetical protein VE954_33790 [Oligoflexus sp.]|uniref:hypothetical protein n=1 Tax=Oligoflexus sp. TaxID=1971216 RepID=UPI002D6B1DB8|nr:hypothetical protein [Oligoflexus sp.]HYX38099.1 hypothetical protein [Oligoflexus sp.]
MKHLVTALVLSFLGFHASQAHAENIFRRMTPPDEQGQLREEKSITVGLPLTLPFNLPSQAQYRLGQQWLIGGGFTVEESGKDEDDRLLFPGHRYETQSQIGSAYVEYYVSGKSGFHIGFGVEGRMGKFTELLRDRNGQEQETANGTYHAIYAGPSFGWTWIWTNGVTFGFDISRRKQFQMEILSEAVQGVSAPNTVDVVSSKVIPVTVPGMVMLGFSF